MRGYGLPRLMDVEFPDKADIKRFGLSASDCCARKGRGKTRNRRFWKKRQRLIFKRDLRRLIC